MPPPRHQRSGRGFSLIGVIATYIEMALGRSRRVIVIKTTFLSTRGRKVEVGDLLRLRLLLLIFARTRQILPPSLLYQDGSSCHESDRSHSWRNGAKGFGRLSDDAPARPFKYAEDASQN